MFSADYRIILHDYDDVLGEAGFFRIRCGPLSYGEFFSPEIEMKMSTVWLLNWFEKLIEVCLLLREKQYIALSDVESYNAWIEFKRSNDNVFINVVYSESLHRDAMLFKEISVDIPRKLSHDACCLFSQMNKEIIQKATNYIADILLLNPRLLNEEKCLSQNQKNFFKRVERIRKKIDLLSAC